MFFCKGLKANDKVIEIPYEIGRRLIQASVMGFIQTASPNYNTRGYQFNGTTTYDGGKYYLVTLGDISSSYFITATLFLKDI